MNAAIRLLAWSLALLLVALPFVAVLNGWIAAERWPMRRLQVTGEFAHIAPEQVRAAAQPHLGAGFFAVRLDEVRAAVAALPWVQRVEVRKRWPDVLEVALVEHRAWARWGEDRLLSDRGEFFTAPATADLDALPRLSGPDARVSEVVAFYNQARAEFAATGRQVRGTRLSPRGSWSLQLHDGVTVVIGRADPKPRLARFLRVLPQLIAAEQRTLLRADLRYTNGFALTWAEQPAQGGAPKSTQQART